MLSAGTMYASYVAFCEKLLQVETWTYLQKCKHNHITKNLAWQYHKLVTKKTTKKKTWTLHDDYKRKKTYKLQLQRNAGITRV